MAKTMKVKDFFKRNGVSLTLAFLIPMIIMVIAYYRVGVYPGSKLSMMASDSFSQYSNFHASFNNVLHGKQDPFYTWSGSLGLNYWSLSAYYLNGIFTFLVFFFDNIQMPEALYFLTILKIGVSALAFWFFARGTYRKLNQWMIAGLSIAYALSAYAVGYSEVIMWLDVMTYLPLVILGIHRLIEYKKPMLLFISYLLLFLSSFYLGFMVGVFSFLYYTSRVIAHWHENRRSIPMYLTTSLLAGGASMVTILPTLIDLRSNGESLTIINRFFTGGLGPWDLIAKSMVGVYDTSKYEAMPFIYAGILPLLFFVFYFFTKKISWKDKVANGVLVALLIASIYIYPLNLFWHGFHSPNMFLFRFSFLISFMILMLAGYAIEALNKDTLNRFVNCALGTALVFFLFLFLSNKKRYGLISLTSVAATFVFLFVYLIIAATSVKKEQWIRWLSLGLLVLMSAEGAVNTDAMINGISRDWGYPTKALYTEPHNAIQTLVDHANQNNDTFFRMENLDQVSLNDSFNFGYHGVSMFSSIRNRLSSQYINTLGFRSTGTNLQVQYPNNTLYGDALVGIKYNLAKQDPLKFGYKKIKTAKEYSLYENQWALPLGILTDDQIYQRMENKSQAALFNHLSGLDEHPFSSREPSIVESNNAIIHENPDGKSLEIQEKELDKPKTVTWLVTVPAKQQAYLSLVPPDSKSSLVYVKVNDVTRKGDLWTSGQYYNLGYYDKATTVRVQVLFAKSKEEQFKVEIFKPQVILLDTDSYQRTIQAIQKKGVDFKTKGHEATANVQLDQEQTLLTTIPYDKGWEAWIDGKKTEIKPLESAFIALTIPKGAHTVKLRFLPVGFRIGLTLFILCLCLFVGYQIWLKRLNHRKEIIDENQE